MDNNFTAIIQTLVAEQGKDALFSAAKCKAMLADYTRNEYKKESRLLLQAIEAGIAEALSNADDLASCKAQAVQKLQDEYFLAENISADVVDMLAAVLAPPQVWEAAVAAAPRCAKCGKEVQEGWKSCPYCGAAVKPETVEELQTDQPPKEEAPVDELDVEASGAQETLVQIQPVLGQKKEHIGRYLLIVTGAAIAFIAILIAIAGSGSNSQTTQTNPAPVATAPVAEAKNVESLYRQGFQQSYAGNYSASINLFSEAIQLNPNFVQTFNARAMDYWRTGEYQKALNDANKALSLKPGDANILDTRGSAYRGLGDYQKAIADYTESLRINPTAAYVLMNRGITYYWMDNTNAGWSDISKAQDMDKKASARTYTDIATSWYYTGYYSDAVRFYNSALELDPQNGYILQLKANAEAKAN
jgi:tetratricopeptide (TPR) repeat protein